MPTANRSLMYSHNSVKDGAPFCTVHLHPAGNMQCSFARHAAVPRCILYASQGWNWKRPQHFARGKKRPQWFSGRFGGTHLPSLSRTREVPHLRRLRFLVRRPRQPGEVARCAEEPVRRHQGRLCAAALPHPPVPRTSRNAEKPVLEDIAPPSVLLARQRRLSVIHTKVSRAHLCFSERCSSSQAEGPPRDGLRAAMLLCPAAPAAAAAASSSCCWWL